MSLSNMEDKQNPLVSVAVITYNSSKTVVETLDSIYNQTYQNIELIISDDCSTDDTIDVCRRWLEQHKDRFVRTEIITVPKNTGVTGNCQRVWDYCKTEWLKFIAGDDLLLPNCIEDFVHYINEHPKTECVFSCADVIGLSQQEKEMFIKSRFDYSFFDLPQEKRYEKILPWCCIPTAAAILNYKKLKERGLNFDMRIPMLEDRIFFLRALELGVYFDFMNKITICYRVRRDSLCNAQILSPRFYESTRLAYFYYVFDKNDQIDHDMAIKQVVDNEMGFYYEYYQLKQISQTKAYKIAKYISNPQLILHRIAQIFKNK